MNVIIIGVAVIRYSINFKHIHFEMKAKKELQTLLTNSLGM